jgi:hypothetical protein
MTRVTQEMVARAEGFVWLTGRVLDQRRFAYHFGSGTAAGVRSALDAYRAPDVGFAFGLEPDVRGQASQPVTMATALKLLDEIGQLDAPAALPLCGWLASVSAPGGGVPVVLPSQRAYPHPPWLSVADDPPGELLATGPAVGMLLKNKIGHPWLRGATGFCWRAVETLTETHPYEVEAAVAFLDHVPDRDRAAKQAARLGGLVRDQGLFLDPAHPDRARLAPGYAPGEFHLACDYAIRPASVGRAWFTDAEFARSLDALAAAQQEDGGWPISWAQWSPTTASEARPGVTTLALLTLRAYDAAGR